MKRQMTSSRSSQLFGMDEEGATNVCLPPQKGFREQRRIFTCISDSYEAAASVFYHEKFGSKHPHYSDFDLFPIIFLCRHALELRLKTLLMLCMTLRKTLGKRARAHDIERLMGEHHLRPLLSMIQALWPEDRKPFSPDFCRLLNEFDRQDAQSMTFRYAFDKRGNLQLPKVARISARQFWKKQQILQEQTRGQIDGISAWIQSCQDESFETD